jgi:hypothetical protein
MPLLCSVLANLTKAIDKNFKRYYLCFVLLAGLLYYALHYHEMKLDVQGFHSWRQSWTQTNIKHFSISHKDIFSPTINNTNLANDKMVFAWEFPMYQYCIGMFNRIAGYKVVHSRWASLLLTLLGAACFGLWMRAVFKQNMSAIVGMWMMLWVPVNYYYGINIQPDFLAYNFSIVSLYLMCRYYQGRHVLNAVLSIMVFMIVCLQKLPYIIIAPALCWMAWHTKQRYVVIAALCVAVAPAYWWYHNKVQHFTGGAPQGILATDTYTLNDIKNTIQFYWQTQWPVYFIGKYNIVLFLWGAFSLLFVQWRKVKAHEAAVWLVFAGVFAFWVFELNMISYHHNYYVMLFMVFTTYLVCKGLSTSIKPIALYAIIAMAILPLVSKKRCAPQWHETNSNISSAVVNHAEQIKRIVPNNAPIVVSNDVSGFVTLYHLDRKGTTLASNDIDSNYLHQLMGSAPGYLVTEDTTLVRRNGLLPLVLKQYIIDSNCAVYSLRSVIVP